MNKNDSTAATRRHRRRFAVLLSVTSAVALWPSLGAAQANETPAESTPRPIDVQVFEGVKILSVPGSNFYPSDEVSSGHEGWVTLNMMIDPKGKPYEVMVAGSSGNRAFEKAALKAVNSVRFKPARAGGQPIDSSFMFKFRFAMRTPQKGANRKFISTYSQVTKAITEGDRTAADALLPTLNAVNLYEEAFEHYARYHYLLKWGTPEEQLKELIRAVAGENRPQYLPKELFIDAVTSIFVLQVKLKDYGGALETWKVLEPLAPKNQHANLLGAVNQIKAIQGGTELVRLGGTIGEYASWGGNLFRDRFSIDVTNGVISEIKLRCQTQYVLFRYEPGIQYSIGRNKDTCGIEIVGDPGTKFVLTQ